MKLIVWLYFSCIGVGVEISALKRFKCAQVCTCNVDARTGNLLVDCTNKGLTSLPENLDKQTYTL